MKFKITPKDWELLEGDTAYPHVSATTPNRMNTAVARVYGNTADGLAISRVPKMLDFLYRAAWCDGRITPEAQREARALLDGLVEDE